MTQSHSESYKAAGVDVTAGYRAVELMKGHVARTRIPGVLSELGGFGGLFAPDLSGMKEPVLVSGTDGVGTKLRLAFLMDKHNTIGIDCVAMCVNDIVCSGATPLFFLDYLAVGKNVPERVEQIVAGVAEGCVQAGCALVGGETAEMPGFYPPDDYDLAGFAVGMVDKARMLDNQNVKAGDVLIGFASSGIHSNGFSLVRKAFGIDDHPDILGTKPEQLGGKTLGEALLEPTRIYVKPVLSLLKKVEVHSICHITGGGFYENIPRVLPQGMGAVIDRSALCVPPVFSLIAESGGIPERDMFNTFNMGVGMCAVLPGTQADEALRILEAAGEKVAVIGTVTDGASGVTLQ